MAHSVLTTGHYPDLSSASDWLKHIFHPARPIRGIYPDLCSHTLSVWNFYTRSSDVILRGGAGKFRLFSQTSFYLIFGFIFLICFVD